MRVHSICRTVASAVLAVALLVPAGPEAQESGALAGRVVDDADQPLPGVKVTVTTSGLRRTAVTDPEGRYRLSDLPAGAYTVRAELAGFDTAAASGVVISAGASTALSLVLQPGCLEEVLYVDMGFARTLQEADAVLHIRILESGSGERCPDRRFCACTEHAAAVRRILKSSQPGLSLTTIRFLQEAAGIAEGSRAGMETPYAPGQEFIAFLQWDPAVKRFMRITGPLYMFPVRDGRVEFRRTDAPGLSDGMAVADFSRALQALGHGMVELPPSAVLLDRRP